MLSPFILQIKITEIEKMHYKRRIVRFVRFGFCILQMEPKQNGGIYKWKMKI